jgi:S1-C subfamily serine protease
VVSELVLQGYYPRPDLGAQMLPLTTATAQVLREAGMDVSLESGLLVLSVTEGGPADQAGAVGGNHVVRIGRYRVPLGGDTIVAVNGTAVGDSQDLTAYL